MGEEDGGNGGGTGPGKSLEVEGEPLAARTEHLEGPSRCSHSPEVWAGKGARFRPRAAGRPAHLWAGRS